MAITPEEEEDVNRGSRTRTCLSGPVSGGGNATGQLVAVSDRSFPPCDSQPSRSSVCRLSAIADCGHGDASQGGHQLCITRACLSPRLPAPR